MNKYKYLNSWNAHRNIWSDMIGTEHDRFLESRRLGIQWRDLIQLFQNEKVKEIKLRIGTAINSDNDCLIHSEYLKVSKEYNHYILRTTNVFQDEEPQGVEF